VWLTNELNMHEHVMRCMHVCACQQKNAELIYAQKSKGKRSGYT